MVLNPLSVCYGVLTPPIQKTERVRSVPVYLRLNLPNLITMARLLSGPLVVWLLVNGAYVSAFWLFVVAALSDAVDGFLAKRFGLKTILGAYLDPIADKVLLVGVFITFGLQGQLVTWLVILVVFRDLLIIGGFMLLQLIGQEVKMQPAWSSKLNTTAQIMLAGLILASLGIQFQDADLIETMTWVVALTTAWSGAEYIVWAFQQVNGGPPPPTEQRP